VRPRRHGGVAARAAPPTAPQPTVPPASTPPPGLPTIAIDLAVEDAWKPGDPPTPLMQVRERRERRGRREAERESVRCLFSLG